MTGPWADKLSDIVYFVVPLIFLIAGIVIWDRTQKNKKIKDDQDPGEKHN